MALTEHGNKKGFITRNVWTILLCVALFLGAACVGGIFLVKQNAHSFRDFVVGEVAYTGTNKSGEWTLFWALLIAGCILTIVLAYMEKRHEYQEGNVKRIWLFYGSLCFLPMLTHLIFYGKTTVLMAALTVLAAVLVLLYRENSIHMAALFLCLYFVLESGLTASAVVLSSYPMGDYGAFLCALSLFLLAACLLRKFVTDKKKFYERLLAVAQIPIPALLLLYVKDRYAYEGYVFQVDFPRRYVVIILILIIGLSGYQLIKAVSVFKKGVSSENRVWFPTVFAVFAFVSYMPPAMLVQSDLHHHGEQLLAWQQIVELGQEAYVEYFPASGLFPMLIGAVNSLVFHGQATEYGMSYVLVALLFEGLLMYLLYRRLGGKWTLLIATVFHMPVYCRTWILAPVLLILSEAGLVRKKFSWLLCWVFLCFLSGLYYPLFGVALLLGTFPFGVIQLIGLIRSGAWKKTGRGERLSGIGLFLLIVLSAPLLFHMAKHILSMAGQSLDADGMTVVGYEVPQWFMPYLSGWKYYELLYQSLRILLGIFFVVAAVYLLVRYLKGSKMRRELHSGGFLLLSGVPIVLCVCYTYTMICMDEDWVGNLLSRSGHVILFLCGLLGPVVLFETGKTLLGKRNQAVFAALAFSVPFLFFYECGDYGFPFLEGATDQESYVVGEYSAKLQPYEVRSDYVMLTDGVKEQYPYVDFHKIGDGFIELETLQHLDRYAFIYDYLRQYDEQVEMLGFEQSQLYYFLLNEKAVYSGRTAIAKSQKASEMLTDVIDTEHTVVRQGVSPLEQYYLYRFLVQAGYVYSEELGIYMPQTLYTKIYADEGALEKSPWAEPADCGLVANSFGKSSAFLEKCEKTLEITDKELQIQSTGENTAVLQMETVTPVDGETADFIYLRLKNAEGGRIKVSWNSLDGEGGAVYCDCGDGNLLIPVGINPLWLLSSHTQIEVQLEDCGSAEEIEVEEVSYYRLK